MSTPYDNDPYGNQGGQNPPGGNPYGGQPAGQYGSPYSYPGGAPSETTKTDGVSIAGFVLSLLCCTGLIGMILGFVGLGRTRGGKRKGRWAAVGAIIIGGLATVALVVGGLWVFMFANSFISPDDAEVGQCINVNTEEDENTVYLREKDCSDEHDGEIAYVGENSEIDEFGAGQEDACRAAMSAAGREDDVAAIDAAGEFTWGVATEDPDDAEESDAFICYIESDDKLDSGIL